ncbi:PD-(D/E)XK nuclease family protein [Thalassobacillus pellis]|uniref:PD-(D/E)XK nuclease family protein n=1 Tax=Thalassobacillus pellis TaxID=748008 RepID=UPI001EF927C1|nr:PD-(D/E)XK nuclease family protein [Thalassobacillus pellis]MBM7551973.1 CRISPR/Cas system-associated exonuclease Cas4 (RecB family) [Thalassobacillus pellis]
MKKITSLEILFGSIVHDTVYQVIQHMLNGGSIPAEDKLVNTIRKQLNQGFLDSIKREHLWFDKPKHYTMLHEIYYSQDDQLPDYKVSKIQERLRAVMRNFLNSRTFQDIQDQQRFYFVESENFRYMSRQGVKIYIVMDFVYRDRETGKWIIVDWKTGKASEEDRNQLALYALYLKEKFDIESLDDIVIRNEYLLDGSHKEHQLSPSELSNVETLFNMSLTEMSHYLADIYENKPLDIEEFPMQQDDRKCARCNYQELCFGSTLSRCK